MEFRISWYALCLVEFRGAKCPGNHIQHVPTFLQESQVKFTVESIFLPEPVAVMRELFGHNELVGRIVDFSDSGRKSNRFAIVTVPGLSKPVMVPVEALSVA